MHTEKPDTKHWVERGVGEAMILRHQQHKGIRFLILQENDMKVLANHVVDPRIVLVPYPESEYLDRSFVRSAYDFTNLQLTETIFLLVFENPLTANDFREKFIQSQHDMCDLLKESYKVADTSPCKNNLKAFLECFQDMDNLRIDGDSVTADKSSPRSPQIICSRCGRNSHTVQNCYARSTVDGKSLVAEGRKSSKFIGEGCFRCGRTSHWVSDCYATYDVHGERIYD